MGCVLYWTVDSGRDSGTAGQRDSGTAGQRDNGRDSGTAGQRDSGRAILYWTEAARGRWTVDSGQWTVDGTEWTEALSLL